jgi:hypothetical protein
MEATPFEHVVVIAVAANCTGEPTVSPLAGLLTTTFANTGAENAARISMALKKVFKKLSSGIYVSARARPWRSSNWRLFRVSILVG